MCFIKILCWKSTTRVLKLQCKQLFLKLRNELFHTVYKEKWEKLKNPCIKRTGCETWPGFTQKQHRTGTTLAKRCESHATPLIARNTFKSWFMRFRRDSRDSIHNSGHRTIHPTICIACLALHIVSRFESYDACDTNYHDFKLFLLPFLCWMFTNRWVYKKNLKLSRSYS